MAFSWTEKERIERHDFSYHTSHRLYLRITEIDQSTAHSRSSAVRCWLKPIGHPSPGGGPPTTRKRPQQDRRILKRMRY
ncbi:hypothetical protein BGAL_0533g00020 [Botrytis galanthina]|uniref:Uncharacterized protein n=1 Tax=Botrytis galanthina TaxID=278940 RepID=A0A4S8QJQ2_9HELO|nr:hypothetical protein BGAL_0533g00020 [Botrytis galanthina]